MTSVRSPNSDADLLDLLRIAGPLRILEMAEAMEVTPTAVRQRLARLTTQGLVQRATVRAGRGRPHHEYWLTEKGVQATGSNFTDLAVALWRELRALDNPQLRQVLLRRVAAALAAGYLPQIRGRTPAERMRCLQQLLTERRIPVSVEEQNHHAALTAHACPYPRLAEQDRAVCAMERLLYSELVGCEVELTHCRLDDRGACRFEARVPPSPTSPDAGE